MRSVTVTEPVVTKTTRFQLRVINASVLNVMKIRQKVQAVMLGHRWTDVVCHKVALFCFVKYALLSSGGVV